MRRSLSRARKDMYIDYCNELDVYDPHHSDRFSVFSRLSAERVCRSYMRRKAFKWIDIYSNNGILIGFLIVARNLRLHGDGLYICEAYIIPEFRKNGYMTTEVNRHLQGYEGNVFFEIYDKNNRAINYWTNRMNKHSASLLGTNESFSGVEGLTEYHYYKNRS